MTQPTIRPFSILINFKMYYSKIILIITFKYYDAIKEHWNEDILDGNKWNKVFMMVIYLRKSIQINQISRS